jgi:hypothetical protein
MSTYVKPACSSSLMRILSPYLENVYFTRNTMTGGITAANGLLEELKKIYYSD